MKEILAGKKANDNVFLINDNGIYMSKGKVVNGEIVGVGRVIESFTFGPTRRLRERGLILGGCNSKTNGRFKVTLDRALEKTEICIKILLICKLTYSIMNYNYG